MDGSDFQSWGEFVTGAGRPFANDVKMGIIPGMTDLRACDCKKLVEMDSWLGPYTHQLQNRCEYYQNAFDKIERAGGLLGPISSGHRYFGFNRGELWGKSGIWYREWAPGAMQLRVIGDFNKWDRFANPMVREPNGVWGLFLPDDQYRDRLTHGSKVKVHVATENGGMDRLPAYIRRVVQDPVTHQ